MEKSEPSTHTISNKHQNRLFVTNKLEHSFYPSVYAEAATRGVL